MVHAVRGSDRSGTDDAELLVLHARIGARIRVSSPWSIVSALRFHAERARVGDWRIEARGMNGEPFAPPRRGVR